MRLPAKHNLILICLVIVVAIATLIVVLSNWRISRFLSWTTAKDTVDIIKNLATIVALIAGGLWCYYNFFKGRTYRPRIELRVSGKLISRGAFVYLVAAYQIKNVGLSDFRFKQKGTALRILGYPNSAATSAAKTVEPEPVLTLSVFTDHGWIEPGELIEEEQLIAIAATDYAALQLRLRIVSGRIEWNATAIIEAPVVASIAQAAALAHASEKLAAPLNVTRAAGVADSKPFSLTHAASAVVPPSDPGTTPRDLVAPSQQYGLQMTTRPATQKNIDLDVERSGRASAKATLAGKEDPTITIEIEAEKDRPKKDNEPGK